MVYSKTFITYFKHDAKPGKAFIVNVSSQTMKVPQRNLRLII